MKLNKLFLAGIVSSLALIGCSPQSNNTTGSLKDFSNTSGDGIIGGTVVQPGDQIQQSIVAVYDAAQGALCTGSLLPNNLVMTAAHCIGADMKKMFILFDTTISKQSFHLPIDGAEVSPYWASRQNADVNTGDIALIHFVGNAPAQYRPATFIGPNNMNLLAKGAPVVIAGYGLDNGVTQQGAGVLRTTTVAIENPQFSESEIELNQTAGQGACHGDSGGPAYIQVNGAYYLWGVTSRGVNDPKNDCTKYSAYTNALVYKDWLNATANKLLNGSQVSQSQQNQQAQQGQPQQGQQQGPQDQGQQGKKGKKGKQHS
ncbi:MAG: S1 family peptidase [Pseudobdellovibrionaceae bacterium]